MTHGKATGPAGIPELAAAWLVPPAAADAPVFRAPWEAQAFAMALALHERGVFLWTEWAATLADVIREAQAAGDPDDGSTYYHHWLVTLERLCAAKGLVTPAALASRTIEWDDAARRTPHGMPIVLE